MSVLIHGLEIPQEGFVEVLIRDDGTVQQTGQSYRIDGTDYYTPYVGEMPTIYKAVPVPPHGRLIDADALMGVIRANDYPLTAHFNSTDNGMFTLGIQQAVDEAPTIIEADPTEEGE